MKCTYESYGTDIGNGFLKINDGRTPAWSTPSWYAEVPPGSQFFNLDLYSQHVRYLDGDRLYQLLFEAMYPLLLSLTQLQELMDDT